MSGSNEEQAFKRGLMNPNLDRRIERLVNPSLNGDLPAFLSPEEGLQSGAMILQYSAASLVSENKTLAHPASVDSIPSSANQEDHVSMGTIGSRFGPWRRTGVSSSNSAKATTSHGYGTQGSRVTSTSRP